MKRIHLMSILLMVSASLTTSTVIAAESANASQPEPTEVRLGTRSNQIILSKITVTDMVKSYEFYTEVIGLKQVVPTGFPEPPAPVKTDPEPAYAEIALNFTGSMSDPFFVLLQRRGLKPTPEAAKLAWIGFKVEDARATMEKIRAAGSKIFVEIPDEAQGMIAGMAYDPDGYIVEVLQTPHNPAPNP